MLGNRLFAPALAAVVIAAASPAARADVSLTFGTYSPDKPSAMVRQLGPTVRALERRMERNLGEPVALKIEVVRDYEDGLRLLYEKKADFARLGPASYVMAKDHMPTLEVLAMEQLRGRKVFNGIIAVHADSPIKEVSELRGKVFGFGSERSTLGRFFAQSLLMQNDIYAQDLKSFMYLGRHDKVGAAVASKLVDAGALEETTFAKLVKSGAPIRAIGKITNATRPWVIRGEVPERVKAALRQALLELKDANALRRLRFEGFLEGSDADYAATRRAIRENPQFFIGRRVTAK